jgi:hypothetical protein
MDWDGLGLPMQAEHSSGTSSKRQFRILAAKSLGRAQIMIGSVIVRVCPAPAR